MPAPCGVPLSVSCHSLLSRIPARSYWQMSLRMRGSAILLRHHPQQLFMVDRIENAANVSIEHPVHALAHQRRVQRRESHMRAPPWPEAVGEAEKVDLVDSAEKLGDGTLDDLVLQSRNAERALPAVGFRDVDTPNRLWPVTARVEACAEIPEVSLQVLLVRRHRHPIDPRTCQPLLSPERSFERRSVDMVQQGCEPGLGGPSGRRVHPREVGRQGFPALRPDLGLDARGPPGWSLPSARLVSFDGFIGTMDQSDSRPQLG